MSLSIEEWYIIAAILLCLNVIIICELIIKKLKNNKFSKEQKNIILNTLSSKNLIIRSKAIASNYLHMKRSIRLDKFKTESIEKIIDIDWAEKKYLKGLKSILKTTRIQSTVYLGMIGTDRARLAIEKSIIKEKDYTVKLYMANALADICKKESIPILVQSLINSHRWYRNKVNMLIADFGEAFNSYLPEIIESSKIEVKELIVEFSSVYFSQYVKSYLVNLIDNKDIAIKKLQALYGSTDNKCCAKCIYSTICSDEKYRLCSKINGRVISSYVCKYYKVVPVTLNYEENYNKLVYRACNILANYYPRVLDNDKYLNSEDIEIKNIAIKAFSNFNSMETLTKLISFLKDDNTSRSAINAISRIIERNPRYLSEVAKVFYEEKDINVKQKLAKVLSRRIEYFIMKLSKNSGKAAAEVIKEILLLSRTSEVIDFLNKNKDIDIENELIAIIKEVVLTSSSLEKEFSKYLSERLLNKCRLTRHDEVMVKKEEEKDKKLIRNLYLLLTMVILIFPVIYALRHMDILFKFKLLEQIKIYIIDFNYYVAFYSIAINSIYFVLLILSYVNVKRQVRLWKIKNISLLFKKKMLPSISIIAPAYNEEKTIIESANSLLNLKYPNYELIIVNDGSKDKTLDVLIKYFDLIRVDYIFDYKLNAKPVRGIYMNRSMPKLIVVDKENGGKADSLNAGINIANKEYFCGIDADSLLEDEALLKLASLTLDEAFETPALGGNVFPINGCSVERGLIKNINIPKNKLARFQTIEYIRAFMAGRLGWSLTNSLLIISGAFGLFRKERVINVGGYLTSSGKYAKDTVGEDMELVVRISRLMKELGQKYRIRYAFNANCWTEVPEDIKTLKKQRYRWHRGLIDILTFHKKMIFNYKYGRAGLIAMPYFFIFEMMGPIIEIQGYIMVVIAFLLGLLNAEIAVMLFVTTILMGVLISVSSLLIAEQHIKYFRLKDILILIAYSIIENFGPRQFFSLWRVGGYLNMLRKPGGWDKAERKGFSDSNTVAKL